MRVTDKGIGNAAAVTPAIPAVTPTPCGINARILEIAKPNVPPMKINGKSGPPSNPVAKDVLVRRALTNNISSNKPRPYTAGLWMICSSVLNIYIPRVQRTKPSLVRARILSQPY
jgi:hypothetical protein